MDRIKANEAANTLTHGIGLILSAIASSFLMARVWTTAQQHVLIGCGVYAAAMIAVYFASMMSHCTYPHRIKQQFRALDQAFIYLLIVATYTPFSLVYLHSRWSVILLAMMWSIAMAGFLSKLWWAHRIDSVSVLTYIVLGWMPVLNGSQLFDAVPADCIWMIFCGGALFTIGTLFLIYDHKFLMCHAIWHVMVIAGSAVHFWAIWRYVA